MPLNINRGKRQKPRRVVLYGMHGVGKSTWAASAPSPIFVPTEDGLDDIECDSFPVCQSHGEFTRNLEAVRDSAECVEYQTCVIDTADWIDRMKIEGIIREAGAEGLHKGSLSFGVGKGKLIDSWRRTLSLLDEIAATGRHVILLAHATQNLIRDPMGEDYHQFALKMSLGETSDLICEWATEVFFAREEVFTRKVEEGFGKESVKATGGGNQKIYTKGKPAFTAKNRCGMPDEIPMPREGGWELFAAHLAKSQFEISPRGDSPWTVPSLEEQAEGVF